MQDSLGLRHPSTNLCCCHTCTGRQRDLLDGPSLPASSSEGKTRQRSPGATEADSTVEEDLYFNFHMLILFIGQNTTIDKTEQKF